MRLCHWILPVCLCVLLGAGAPPDMVRIHVEFDRIDRLQEGDAVVKDQQSVGHVESVEYVDSGFFRATLAIDKTYAAEITEHSRFMITEDPVTLEKKRVKIVQTRTGGKPLANGATVQGSDKYAVLLESIRGEIQDSVDFLKQEVDAFSKDLNRLNPDEKVKALKMEMERIARTMQQATRETREKIEKEVLPLLKKEMEDLREQLRRFDREEEMAPLDQEMKQINRI